MPDYVDEKTFKDIVRLLMKLAATARVETNAMALVLQSHGLLPNQEYAEARASMLKGILSAIDRDDSASPQAFLELLRKFEGPLQ